MNNRVNTCFKYRAEVYTREQLNQILLDSDYEYIYAPMKFFIEKNDINTERFDKSRIILIPPVFLGNNENRIISELTELKKYGYKSVLAHTLGHIELTKSVGMQSHGGLRLNITNSFSMNEYEKLGLTDSVLSIELKMKQAQAIKINNRIPIGIMAYGRLPLMLNRRCPVSDEKTCVGKKTCDKEITDRLGNKLPLLCGFGNEVEILNPDKLYLGDKTDDLKMFDFVVIRFTDETDVEEIKKLYSNGMGFNGKITRGLYYRGVQ